MSIQDIAQSIVDSPYRNERLQAMMDNRLNQDFRAIANAVCAITCPDGYRMRLNSHDYAFLAEAVNQGIDSHLEAFTQSSFNGANVVIHPTEMGMLLDRLNDLNIAQSNKEWLEAGEPMGGWEPSSELQNRESFVSSIIELLCRKEQ